MVLPLSFLGIPTGTAPNGAPDGNGIPQVGGQSAQPAPASQSGFGGFFSGLGSLAGPVLGFFQERQSSKEARELDLLKANQSFELEKLRITEQGMFAPPPLGPVQQGLNFLPLPKGAPPILLFAGVGLLAFAFLRRR